MNSLANYHGFRDSVQWRVVRDGVDIAGSGIERSRGRPITVTRIWHRFSGDINYVARRTRVPCQLILATIATESAGNSDAIRLVQGYISDPKTPYKVRIGLTQTPLSTAQELMRMSFSRDWLLEPLNSILVGAVYIASQARSTKLDPPLVAAAYNAGRLQYQNGRRNRWKLRQEPVGSGKHVDRFVQFFNDAMAILANDNKAALRYETVVSGSSRSRPRQSPAPLPTNTNVQIRFAKNARYDDVTPFSKQVIRDIASEASVQTLLVSSTSRNPYDQARVMYNNLEKYGVEHQKNLYGSGGDLIIDVYAVEKGKGRDKAAIIAAMRQKIIEVGPTRVSRHASDPKKHNVFDIAPSSIARKHEFARAVRADKRVTKFLLPPDDPGYHLEIPQPRNT